MNTAKKKIIEFIKSLPDDFSHESIILTLVIQDMETRGIPFPDLDRMAAKVRTDKDFLAMRKFRQ
ncbi:MAG: hypothetical protein CVV44_19865 [Spirochaetae bacterium HGW-Spirochaetae-1]|jgi:hypothetical protein|nr:MAG: hypothetical protein CVV44_19865 [Spirochaetae bacterium HGW-Spirochaetae-1]